MAIGAEDTERRPEDSRRSDYGALVPGHDRLGPRLRELRKSRGLSLVEVAEATDISSSFLSLLETDKSDITFGRLVRLLDFYGISIADVIPDPEPQQTVVVHREARRRLESRAERAWAEFLTHDTRHKMLPALVALEPGGEIAEAIEGAAELFLFVLRGEIEITGGNEPIRLRKGDAAYYRTDRRRTVRNTGRARAEWLSVQMPNAV
jgi:transcriptional regulator with XRE-family HTH domain